MLNISLLVHVYKNTHAMPFDFFNQLEHNNGTYQSADKNEIGRDCYSSFCRLLIQILYTV